MNFEAFVDRAGAASLKLLVAATAALAILVGMAGDLAAWPVSIIPLALPLVWFFFTAVLAASCIGAATLFGFFPNRSARMERHSKRLLAFLMVLSVGSFATAIWHVPGAFSDMTQRLPHEPSAATPDITPPSPAQSGPVV